MHPPELYEQVPDIAQTSGPQLDAVWSVKMHPTHALLAVDSQVPHAELEPEVIPHAVSKALMSASVHIAAIGPMGACISTGV
jgi:hypothetical protein